MIKFVFQARRLINFVENELCRLSPHSSVPMHSSARKVSDQNHEVIISSARQICRKEGVTTLSGASQLLGFH